MFYYRKYYPTCIEQNFGNLRNKIKTQCVESKRNVKTCSSLKHSQIAFTDPQMNVGRSNSFVNLGNTKLQNEKHQQMPYNYKCCTNKYNNNFNLSACVKCCPTTSCSHHQLPLNYQKKIKKCDCKFQDLKISNDVSIKHKNKSEEMGSDSSKLRNLSVSNQQKLYDSNCFEKQHYPCIYKIANGTPFDRLPDENNLIYNKTSNHNNTCALEKATSNTSTSVQLVHHGINCAAPLCHRHYCHCDHLKKTHVIGKTYNQQCDNMLSDTLQSDVSNEIYRRSIDSSAVSNNYMDALNINIDPKLNPCIKHICAANVNRNAQNGEYKCRRNNNKLVNNYLHRSQPKLLSVSKIMRKFKKNNLKHFYSYNKDIKTSKFSDTNEKYNDKNRNIANATIHNPPAKQDVRNKFDRNNKDNDIAVHNNTGIAYNQLQTNYEVDKLQGIISKNNQESGSSYDSKRSASTIKETTTTTLENSMEESKNIKQYPINKSKKQLLKKECTNKMLLQMVYPIKNHQIFNKKPIRNRMLVTLSTSSSLNTVYYGKKRYNTKIGKRKYYCRGERSAHRTGKLSSATMYSSNPSIIPRVFEKPKAFRKRRQKYRIVNSKSICWNQKYNDSHLNKLDHHFIKDIILPNFDTKGFHNLQFEPGDTTVYVVKFGDTTDDGVSNDNALDPSEQVKNKRETQSEDLLNYERKSDEGSIISCSTCGTLCDELCISSLILLACKNLAAKGDQNIQEGTTTLNRNIQEETTALNKTGEEYIRPERMHTGETNEIYNQCICSSKQRIPFTRNVSTMVKRKSTMVSSRYYDSDIIKLSKKPNRNQNAIESTSSTSEYGDNLSSFSHETGDVTDTSSTSLFDSVIILHGIKNSQSEGSMNNSTSSYDTESKLSSSVEKIPHGTCICHDENFIKHISKTHTQLQSPFTNHSTPLKKTMNCNCGIEVSASEINHDEITKKQFTNYESHTNFNYNTDGHIFSYTTQSRLPSTEYTSAKPEDPSTDRSIDNMSAIQSGYCTCYDYPTAKHDCFKKDCNCYKNNINGYSTEVIQSERPQTIDTSVERSDVVELPSKSGAQLSTTDNGVQCASSTYSIENCKRFVDELNFINPLRNDIVLDKIHKCDPEKRKQTSEEREINKNEATEEKLISEIKEKDTYKLREAKQNFKAKILDIHLPEEKQSFQIKEIDQYEPTEEKQTLEIVESDACVPGEGKKTFEIKTIDVYLPEKEKQTFEVKKVYFYQPSELNKLNTCEELKFTCVTPSTSQIVFKQTKLQTTTRELGDMSTKITASDKHDEPIKENQTSEIKESDACDLREEKQNVEVTKICVDKTPDLNKLDTCQEPNCTCVTPKSQITFEPSELNKLNTCEDLKFTCVTPSTSQIVFKQTKLQTTPRELGDMSTKITASDKHDEPTEENQTSEIKESDACDLREEKQTVEVTKICVDKTPDLNKLDTCQEPKCTCVTPKSQITIEQAKLPKNKVVLEEISTEVTAKGSNIHLYANLSCKHIISTKKSVSCQYSLTDINLKQSHIVHPEATKEDKEIMVTKDEPWYDQQTEEIKPLDEQSKEMLKEEQRQMCNRTHCNCDIVKGEPWYVQQTEETKSLDGQSKEMLKEEQRQVCNRTHCNCDIVKGEPWYVQQTDEPTKKVLKDEHRPVCIKTQCNCEEFGIVKQTQSELLIVSNVEDIPVSGYIEEDITSNSISEEEVQNNMLSPSVPLTELRTAAALESYDDKKKPTSSDTFILNEIKQFTTVPKEKPKEKLPQKPVFTKQIDTAPPASHNAIKKLTTSKQPSIVAIRDKAVKCKETKSTKTVIKSKQIKVQCFDKTNLKYESVDSKVYFRITKPRSYNRNYCLNITPMHHTHQCTHLDSLCNYTCSNKWQAHDRKCRQPNKWRRASL